MGSPVLLLNSISQVEKKYYADGEDAFAMKRVLTDDDLEIPVDDE